MTFSPAGASPYRKAWDNNQTPRRDIRQEKRELSLDKHPTTPRPTTAIDRLKKSPYGSLDNLDSRLQTPSGRSSSSDSYSSDFEQSEASASSRASSPISKTLATRPSSALSQVSTVYPESLSQKIVQIFGDLNYTDEQQEKRDCFSTKVITSFLEKTNRGMAPMNAFELTFVAHLDETNEEFREGLMEEALAQWRVITPTIQEKKDIAIKRIRDLCVEVEITSPRANRLVALVQEFGADKALQIGMSLIPEHTKAKFKQLSKSLN